MGKTLNINEACKLAKTISDWGGALNSLIRNENYIYLITETHNREAINPEGINEIKPQEENRYNLSIDEAIKLNMELIKEKGKISKAIEETKNSIYIDANSLSLNIDSAIEYNKGLRSFIYSLEFLSSQKDSKEESKGFDYKFDNEGKQTTYVYKIDTDYKITFDKDKTKKLERELKELANRISIEIDKAKINTIVEVETKYDINDRLEDVISKFKESKG